MIFLFLIARQGYDLSFFLPALKPSSPSTFTKFFHELSVLGVDLPFAAAAATKVRAVRFSAMPPDVGALYNAFTNVMFLPLSVLDEKKSGLKSVSQMNTYEISAIVHELWHCYFKKIAIPERTALFKRFEANSWVIKTEGRISLEEAQASYIGDVAGALVQFKRKIRAIAPHDPRFHAKLLGFQQDLNYLVSIREFFGYFTDWYRNEVVVTESPLPFGEKQALLRELFPTLKAIKPLFAGQTR
ncbi:MAG: hypothetical protein SGJ18_09750 [Pseudomonadota bacterium]|nr:hypothetical protein [Pseudomonadota bacterium]